MSDDKPLKSAYELAMERLRAKDREAGIEESAPLTPEQKQAIAELRRKAQATSYNYSISVGLRYTFGSIYSNVVNPRFGR